jgi:hypothetical protein
MFELSFIALQIDNMGNYILIDEFSQTILESEAHVDLNEVGLLTTDNKKFYITTEPFEKKSNHQVCSLYLLYLLNSRR